MINSNPAREHQTMAIILTMGRTWQLHAENAALGHGTSANADTRRSKTEPGCGRVVVWTWWHWERAVGRFGGAAARTMRLPWTGRTRVTRYSRRVGGICQRQGGADELENRVRIWRSWDCIMRAEGDRSGCAQRAARYASRMT
jgi:hypothetical protein